MDKIIVTWKEVQNYIDKVVEEIVKCDYNPSGVYGIPRGGLIFAVMLSHKLNIPLLMAPANNCIIVDDIADSGRSLYHYTENDTQFNKFFITTMYYHNRSIVKPNFWLYEKKDNWIQFPWEVE